MPERPRRFAESGFTTGKFLQGQVICDHSLELWWEAERDCYTIAVRLVNSKIYLRWKEYKSPHVAGEIVALYRAEKQKLLTLKEQMHNGDFDGAKPTVKTDVADC